MIAEPMIEVTLRVANSLKEVAAGLGRLRQLVMGRAHGNGADLAPRKPKNIRGSI
jgi:hypothetical protein